MSSSLIPDLLDLLDELSGGVHPGFRPAHAKGLMCVGTFSPSPEAARLTRAPHATRGITHVTVRYSNSTGIPTIPDNDPGKSGPRGFAVRFHLADHVHTDIVAHSTNGFPVRTGEEFLEFLRAAAAAGAGKPEVMGAFLAAHPAARRFVETPKPIPTSFAREAFFAVTSFKFINAEGVGRQGRFFASGPKKAPSISRTSKPPRSPRISSSRRSARGWQERPPGWASSCSWPATATT